MAVSTCGLLLTQAVFVPVIIFFFIAYSPIFLDVDPQPFSSIEAQEMKEKLSQNDRLSFIEKRFFNEIAGPESFAVHEGKIFTGLRDGRIIAFHGDTYQNFSFPTEQCSEPKEQHLCSRPLGMRFMSNGILYVADTIRGLLKVDIKTGDREVILKAGTVVDGIPILFLNNLCIDEESDVIYLSEASTKWSSKQVFYIYLETKPSGRILKYHLKTKSVSTVVNGLFFGNGVQLSHDKKSLLIADTTTTCVKRFHLEGPNKGKIGIFTCGLPGFPDNISPTKRKSYWVAMAVSKGNKSTVLIERIFNLPPLIRKVMLRVMDRIGVAINMISQNFIESIHCKSFAEMFSSGMYLFLQACEKYGLIVELDENGNIIDSLHAPEGEIYFISEVLEHEDGNLYLGSYFHNFIGVVNRYSLSKG
ncbi:Adipocyte plasma membrane-associated protein [Nymphon striatum]|nr:Adipocyte plasma membrane-associated protein [Nymphon striatum]